MLFPIILLRVPDSTGTGIVQIDRLDRASPRPASRLSTIYYTIRRSQVVMSQTDKGIMLVRYLIRTDSKFQELANTQNEAQLEVGN